MSRRRRKARRRGQAPKRPGASDAPSPAAPGPARWGAFLPVLIVVAGIAAYWNSFGGGFLLDDRPHIVTNPRLGGGSLMDLLGVERPVVELSLALNHSLHGLEVWGYHLVNLGVHLLAGLTLFGIVRRTLQLPALAPRYADQAPGYADQAPGYANQAPGLALAAALVWVVHPLQTQSVTYLIQRGESLMGLGYLLTLYCLIRSAEGAGGRARWTLAAIASAALGMGAKAILITAPALLLLYDRVFLASTLAEVWRRRWRLHAGVIAAILAVGLATAIIPTVLGGAAELERDDFSDDWRGRAQSPAEYYLAQPAVALHYLELAVWPRVLVMDYKWAPLEVTEWSRAVAPGAAVLALLALTLWALLRAPPLGFLGAWFFVILAPTFAVWKLELAFEHRMYLPLAAPVVLGVLAVHAGLGRAMPSGAAARVAGGVLLAVVTVALGYRTAQRNLDYASQEKMLRADLAVRPDNDRLHFNLGILLSREGKTLEAVERYEDAIRLQPSRMVAHVKLATAYDSLGRYEDAMARLRHVLEINPRSVVALSNMGNTLLRWSATLKLQGRAGEAPPLLRQAILHYRLALELDPRHRKSLSGLGYAHTELAEPAQAEQAFRRALEQDPTDAGVLVFLGHALLRQGRHDEAEGYLRRGLEIDPALAEAQGWLDEIAPARIEGSR